MSNLTGIHAIFAKMLIFESNMGFRAITFTMSLGVLSVKTWLLIACDTVLCYILWVISDILVWMNQKLSIISNSNTDRQKSQSWLNLVIITAQTSGTSFGRQFDFHDVIYHVQPCYTSLAEKPIMFSHTRSGFPLFLPM